MHKKIGLLSAIGLSMGTMIGSGWLFSCYYAAQIAGPASIASWFIGAFIALLMSLMLAEIASVFPQRGLFTRLITLSHNKDFGFISGISNWIIAILVIPSEATASIQYLSTLYPNITPYLFLHNEFTYLGTSFVILLMLCYFLLNFWGLQLLVKFNNFLTVFKVIIPLATAIIIIQQSFHVSNFNSIDHGFMPHGTSSIFSAIVTSGIFFAFFGFQTAVSFANEIDNPRRNIPIVLVSSILVVLTIYIALQIAFIGGLPTHMLNNGGWGGLHFTSPLAELSAILGLHLLVLVLYADASISPSGTGIIYMGSSTRMLTAMSQHKQLPAFFSKLHKNNFSRRSLWTTFFACSILVMFFRNWQSLAIFTTTFILFACISLPISYAQLRKNKYLTDASFKLKFGRAFALFIFLFLNILFFQVPYQELSSMVIFHFVVFIIYNFIAYNNSKTRFNVIKNTYSIMAYMIFLIIASPLQAYAVSGVDRWIFITLFYILLPSLFYWLMVNQPSDNPANPHHIETF